MTTIMRCISGMILPEVEGTISDEDDAALEVFLPDKSRPIPTADIEALLAADSEGGSQSSLFKGMDWQPLLQLSENKSENAHNSTDASAATPDQHTGCSSVLQTPSYISSSTTAACIEGYVAQTRDLHASANATAAQHALQCSSDAHAQRTAETSSNCKAVYLQDLRSAELTCTHQQHNLRGEAASIDASTAVAAEVHSTSVPAAAVEGTSSRMCESNALQEQQQQQVPSATSSNSASFSCSSKYAQQLGTYNSASMQDAATDTAPASSKSSSSSSDCITANRVVLLADGLLDDEDLDDLLLRLAAGRESSTHQDTIKHASAAGAAVAAGADVSAATNHNTCSTSTAAPDISVAHAADSSSSRSSQSPTAEEATAAVQADRSMSDVYSAYKPRWAKQQQQQHAGCTSTAGRFSGSSNSSSSLFCETTGDCQSSPSQGSKLWLQPAHPAARVVDLRGNSKQQRIGTHCDTELLTTTVTCSAAKPDTEAAAQGAASAAGWMADDESGSSSSDSDSDDSEDDWRAFRQQVRRTAATAVQ